MDLCGITFAIRSLITERHSSPRTPKTEYTLVRSKSAQAEANSSQPSNRRNNTREGIFEGIYDDGYSATIGARSYARIRNIERLMPGQIKIYRKNKNDIGDNDLKRSRERRIMRVFNAGRKQQVRRRGRRGGSEGDSRSEPSSVSCSSRRSQSQHSFKSGYFVSERGSLDQSSQRNNSNSSREAQLGLSRVIDERNRIPAQESSPTAHLPSEKTTARESVVVVKELG